RSRALSPPRKAGPSTTEGKRSEAERLALRSLAVAPPLLLMRSITKSFGGAPVLRDVSFEVLAGEVHVLAGENGAGKSTLMRILAGAESEFDGEVQLGGEPVAF